MTFEQLEANSGLTAYGIAIHEKYPKVWESGGRFGEDRTEITIHDTSRASFEWRVTQGWSGSPGPVVGRGHATPAEGGFKVARLRAYRDCLGLPVGS